MTDSFYIYFSVDTKKFNEVQSSLTLSSHGYLGYLVVMNQQFWDK